MKTNSKKKCFIHNRNMEFDYLKGYFCPLCELIKYNSEVGGKR